MSSPVALHPFQEEDWPTLLSWQNDDQEVDLRQGRPFPVDRQGVLRWLSLANSQERYPSQVIYALTLPTAPHPVGFVQLQDIHWLERTAEVGIFVSNAGLRGKGIGQAALGLLIHYGFHRLGLERLWAQILSENIPAITVFQKQGFVQEGVLRRHAFRQGRRQDVAIFGLLRPQP